MNEKDRAKIRASLIEALEEWLSSDKLNDVTFPSSLADACIAVISGMVGTEEYLRSDGQIE